MLFSIVRRSWTISLAFAGLFALSSSTPLLADEPIDPNRPSAVTTKGVPIASPDVFSRYRQYQSVRSASFSGWSPDGKGILVATRFGAAQQLHRVARPGAMREQITFFDEPASGRYIPGMGGKAMIASINPGGSERYQAYRVDLEKHSVQLLTDGQSRNVVGPISHDGARMIFLSNRRNGRDMDVYVASTERPDAAEMVLPVDGQFWTPTDWSQDGSRVAMIRYVSINESSLALFDLKTKKLQRLERPAPGDKKYAVGSAKFAPDAKSIYLTTDARGEFMEMVRLDLETHKVEWLSGNIPWDVESIEVDPRSGRVALTVNEDGASKLYLFDGKQLRALSTPIGVVEGLEFASDGRQIGFSIERPDAPTDAYSLRWDDGELTRWTTSETGGLDPDKFVAPERIKFKTFDDREIPAYYFKPPSAGKDNRAPVVVSIHGGPESQYRPYYSALTQYCLVELGAAVVYPNVRGSAGYGKTYLQLDNGPKREESVRDIGELLDWIENQSELDPSRVVVVGGSYGGYMVLSSLTHYPDRIRAGIDVVGIANFITFLENTSAYRQDLRRAEYGDERDPQMRAVFERINPTSRADRIRSALLIVHGANDPRVPMSEAEQIAAIVRKQGGDVWTLYADNEGHGFLRTDNRDYAGAIEAMFLKRHLRGE